MKPAPTPHLPEGTRWERLDYALRTVFTVSKEALLKAEEKQKQKWQKKRVKKNTLESTCHAISYYELHSLSCQVDYCPK
jgi:hypothetical protein